MPHTTHFSPTALSYAQALLDLANERDQQQEAVGQELRDIRQIIDANGTFAQFLADPAIGEAEKGQTLQKIFGGRISKLLTDFIGVLNQKGRLSMIPEIVGAYDELLDEQMSKVEVDVTVAQKLDDGQLEQVRQRVSAALKRDAVVHQYVDESIIGGLVLRVQDQLIDGSVRHQLESIKEKLMSARTQVQ
ncbi:MAG: ATP synthase F1 subunit delta [Phycisphaerae bacterium]|nr:ATP synthase F1 subunit delta [Phycisphaerae bacterium]